MTPICKNCSNFLNQEVGTAREDVWYNHYCLATLRPTRIDSVDGIDKPDGSDSPFEYCRVVNKGACEKYEQAGIEV